MTNGSDQIYNIRLCAVYGGAGKYEMSKTLKESPECVVATPGRFIEMVRNKVRERGVDFLAIESGLIV